MGNESTTDKPSVNLTSSTFTIKPIVPECCRENFDTCPHKLKKPEKQQYNPV